MWGGGPIRRVEAGDGDKVFLSSQRGMFEQSRLRTVSCCRDALYQRGFVSGPARLFFPQVQRDSQSRSVGYTLEKSFKIHCLNVTNTNFKEVHISDIMILRVSELVMASGSLERGLGCYWVGI